MLASLNEKQYLEVICCQRIIMFRYELVNTNMRISNHRDFIHIYAFKDPIILWKRKYITSSITKLFRLALVLPKVTEGRIFWYTPPSLRMKKFQKLQILNEKQYLEVICCQRIIMFRYELVNTNMRISNHRDFIHI